MDVSRENGLSSLFECIFSGSIHGPSDAKRLLQPWLCNEIALAALDKGHRFIDSACPPDAIHLLVTGACRVGASSPEGGEMIAELLVAPQILGVPELFLPAGSYRADVYTSAPSVLLSIQSPYFLQLLEGDVAAWLFLARHLSQLALRNMDKVRMNALMNRKEYLALYLLECCEDQPLPHRIIASRSVIAAHLNINLRTLSRYIERLEAEGCLSIRNRKLVISQENLARLRQKAKRV